MVATAQVHSGAAPHVAIEAIRQENCRVTLDWLGTATFRLTIGDLVVFLDAYMDRMPTAPPVGLHAKDVTKAHFVLVGHSHFDHLAGAEVIAANTGAQIVGSNETCRVMREHGIPGGQLLNSQGGERHDLGEGVTVRVFPSLHSCLWADFDGDLDQACVGQLGLTENARATSAQRRSPGGSIFGSGDHAQKMLEHIRGCAGSGRDGGPLAYLIETPAGSIFYQDTSGCWTGVLREISADVAILALSGRANVDGEPIQGSLVDFVVMEVQLLQPHTVFVGHHDNWSGVPDRPARDLSSLRTTLRSLLPSARLLEPGYLEGTVLFDG